MQTLVAGSQSHTPEGHDHKDKCWQGYGRHMSHECPWKQEIPQLFGKPHLEVSIKNGINIPWPRFSTFKYIYECKYILKGIYWNVHGSSLHISQNVEKPEITLQQASGWKLIHNGILHTEKMLTIGKWKIWEFLKYITCIKRSHV